MSGHTPGPWFEHREGFSTVYVEARIDGGLIQEVAACGPTHKGHEEQQANARLIAAAPELLDALQRLSDQAARLRMPGQPMSDAEKFAIAAIEKAERKTP